MSRDDPENSAVAACRSSPSRIARGYAIPSAIDLKRQRALVLVMASPVLLLASDCSSNGEPLAALAIRSISACGATATTGQLAVGKSALRAALSSAAEAMATGLRPTRFFPRQCSSAHCVGCRRFGSPVTLKPPRSVLAAQSVQPSCRRPVVHPAQLRTLTSTVSC
jgi:hypothetical protein